MANSTVAGANGQKQPTATARSSALDGQTVEVSFKKTDKLEKVFKAVKEFRIRSENKQVLAS